MQKYTWIKYNSLNFIYNINEDYIYDYNWNKVMICDIPESLKIKKENDNYEPQKSKGKSTALYLDTKYVFCSKNNKSTFYYHPINRVEDLDIQIDSNKDIIVVGDKCFFNGKKTKCILSDRKYMFIYGDRDLYAEKGDKIIKLKYIWQDRLNILKKIKSLNKQ